MKVGILTFQFAHNYGAMLQAYALMDYLRKKDLEVEIIPYYPARFRLNYNVNPFQKGVALKSRLGKIFRYVERKKQANLFESFKNQKLYRDTTIEFDHISEVKGRLKCYDIVIYGSDQIWNTDINFDDIVYFGYGYEGKKVAYAASLGIMDSNNWQDTRIREYLPKFKYISVREPSSKERIWNIINIGCEVVCDPIFLKSSDEWRREEKQLVIDEPYALVYLLQNNQELVESVINYATNQGIKIYSIHPTNGIYPQGTIPLKKVGPSEFLYLVDKAEVICTNSFHCVAFSIIFNKNLIHIPTSNSPERTVALLNRVGVYSSSNKFNVQMSEYNMDQINQLILESKLFLESALYIKKNL